MILKLIKAIPYFRNKIKLVKPSHKDILYIFFKQSDAIKFIDVGANKGQTIDFIKKIFPNAMIFSFEPTYKLQKYLSNKYSNIKNVEIVPLALGDKNEEISFYESEFDATNSLLKPNIDLYQKFEHSLVDVLKETKERLVNCRKLDTWYNANLLNETIDVLKIDVQGFEYNVILGGRETLVNHIKVIYFEVQYLEFYKNATPFYKIFELLYDYGFYYYRQIDSNTTNSFHIIESDVFFVNHRFFDSSKI